MDFSKRMAIKRKIKHLDLEEKLRKAKEVSQKEPENRINNEYIKDILLQIRSEEKLEIASRIHNSHYKDICIDRCYLNTAKKLQKKSAEDRHFYSLKGRNKEIIYDTKVMVTEMKGQMEEHFTRQGTKSEIGKEFLSQVTSILELDTAEFLERNLTGQEITESIQSFQGGKTPGSDGLPIECF